MNGNPENQQRLTFGRAIESLKAGYRVCRTGWNGKGMYLWLLPAAIVKSEWCREPHLKAVAEANGGQIEALGSIRMMTDDKKVLTGWLASQTDMLAEDWEILPDVQTTPTEPSSEACDPPQPVPVPTTEPTTEPTEVAPPPVISVALTDQDMAVVAKTIRGENPLSIPDKGIRDAASLALICDAHGFRVMSSEDFAGVKMLIEKSRRELSVPMADTAARVLSYLGDAKGLLDAWNPKGR